MTEEDTKQNVNFVIPLVNKILQYVHERDRRFKQQQLNVGSYYCHLKVTRADEFDYSVVLDIGSSLDWGIGTPSYYRYNGNNDVVRSSIPLPSAPTGKCVSEVAGLTHKYEAVNRLNICQYVDAKRLSESPATTLIISHPNIVGDTISVDLTPLIEAHLSFKPEFAWPRSGARWPSFTKHEEIKAEGIHQVAKYPLYWSLLFVTCEKKLLDGIDSNGTCRKKSQRIMKKLREMWCPKETKQELSSYHLKNILFWECENHPYDSEWTNDQISYVHERDRRFKIQPLNVGSFYSRLKVSGADEFDYSVVLDTGPLLAWTTGTPAYYGYTGNQEVVCKSIPLPSLPIGKCLIEVVGLTQRWNNENLKKDRLV
ncbi:unnamed protein product [Mytilus edulis]|uniref:Uncharacterized protein n=1 Tax=Mytilus edulis TaxID=6550 RepID=A0A8S3VJC7_MYTED|nr:unnamed protein product [Mytilus edulis]